MQCSICGGIVIWKGPLVSLTHTECQKCGAMNSQVTEEPDYDDKQDNKYCECQRSPSEEEECSGICDACGGIL